MLIAATREAELREFFVEHAQNTYRYRVPLIDAELGRAPRERAKPEKMDALRLPNASVTRSLYLRDGHRCRYCDGEVFPQTVLKELHRLMPEEFPVDAGNSAKHGAYLAFAAVLDHVQPYSAGGTSGKENLVISCWPCNFGKSSASLEDLMLEDPRSRPPRIDEWDGGVATLGQ